MTIRGITALAALLALAAGPGPAQQPPAQGQQNQGQQEQARGQRQQQQVRDRAAQPQGTAVISGRVLTADTARPVKRARVSVSGGGRGGRSTTTDEQGRFHVDGLSAGNYTITASKTGFVDSIYGQRRPLQPGTPVTVVDAQQVANVDLRLTRGGVITGRVVDEDGEPLARALVSVQRYQYLRGEKQLSTAGADQTDDRGQYRVFGLPPGDYYVSASVAGLAEMLGRGMQQLAAGLDLLAGPGGRGGGGRGGLGAVLGGFGGADQQETSGYAPTYYPGVVSATEAGKVTLGPGQEFTGVDFQIQLVPFARVAGIVAGAENGANVLLVPQDGSGGGGRGGRLGGQTLMGRAQADGTFAVVNVPPGRYTAVARSLGRGGELRTAMQPIVVNGQNIDGVTLALQPGVTLSGNITVESSGTPAPTDYSVFRVEVPELDPLPGGGSGRGGPFGGRGVEKNGSFAITNLLPGMHYVRVTGGGAQGAGQWTLKSILVGGAEVADQPFELKPGENVDGVTVILTDRSSEISGTVRDARGTGAAALTVIAFSTDEQFWRSQSRRIQTARTGETGAYRIRALPSGDYYVVAVDDVEQGEWFDPAFLQTMRDKATRVSIGEGDKKTQDLRAPS